ncbi:MAG TPA: dihydrofolate reductase family protein, partial [Puia sp.]
NMAILGSGTIVTQLAAAGLIDEYIFMIDPVALGEGTPVFRGMGRKLDLKLKSSKAFGSGVILAVYINQ